MLILLAVLHILSGLCSSAAAEREDPAALAARGEFAAAAAGFRLDAEALVRERRPLDAAMAWSNAASCLKMTGDVNAAALYAEQARACLPADAPAALRVELLALKGSIAALGAKPWEALPDLEEAERLALASGLTATHADVLNDLGIARGALGEFAAALDCFERALAAADACGEAGLGLRVRQNQVVAGFQRWQAAASAFAQEDELKTPEDRAFEAAIPAGERPATAPASELAAAAGALRGLLTAAARACDAAPPSFLSVNLRLTAGLAAHRHGLKRDGFLLLTGALDAARRLDHRPLEVEALLGLAEMYATDRRAADALRCLDQARAILPQPDLSQSSRLELLSATAHHMADPLAPATAAAVLRAISAVESVRGDLARSQAISDLGRPFRERAGLPYLLLADLALRLAERDSGRAADLALAAKSAVSAMATWDIPEAAADAGAALARNAIEAFKAWELQDFYRDDCVNIALSRQRSLDQLGDARTAAIYVIPFDDRTEILAGSGGRLHRATSAVPGALLLGQARRLRARIQWDDGDFRFLDDAEALYEAIIRPLAPWLASKRIRHLVVVPDGALATVPLGVLRDRRANRFLIEDFSISVAPGLAMLPSDRTEAGDEPAVLLGGVTAGAPGFEPLPAARAELAALGAFYPNRSLLVDQAFTKAALQEVVRDPATRVVHLATHGEFRGRADQTYLLCGDGKLTLAEIERLLRPKQFRGQPVDLLCLSACKTAAGDDRAALGMAGAAVKSGARAVVATLWQVDDAATSRIMTDFHAALRDRATTGKAELLRQAQLDCLRLGVPFTHPSLWAPFILVGDWQ